MLFRSPVSSLERGRPSPCARRLMRSGLYGGVLASGSRRDLPPRTARDDGAPHPAAEAASSCTHAASHGARPGPRRISVLRRDFPTVEATPRPKRARRLTLLLPVRPQPSAPVRYSASGRLQAHAASFRPRRRFSLCVSLRRGCSKRPQERQPRRLKAACGGGVGAWRGFTCPPIAPGFMRA